MPIKVGHREGAVPAERRGVRAVVRGQEGKYLKQQGVKVPKI
jgi:hypothetical protein